MKRNSLVAIFLVFAVGAILAYRVGMPLSPEKALTKGLLALGAAEQVSGIASVAVTLPETSRPLTLRGAFSMHVPAAGEPAVMLKFATVEDGGAAGTKAEVQSYPDASYVKVDGPADGKIGTVPLTDVNGTWWKLPAGEKALPADSVFAAEAWRKMKTLLTDGSMYAMEPDVAREQLAGKPVYRFDLALTRQGAEEFVRALTEARTGRLLSPESSAAAQVTAGSYSAKLTFWVDANSGRIAEAMVSLQKQGGTAQTVLIEAIDTVAPFEAKPVPADSKPLTTALEKLLQASR